MTCQAFACKKPKVEVGSILRTNRKQLMNWENAKECEKYVKIQIARCPKYAKASKNNLSLWTKTVAGFM